MAHWFAPTHHDHLVKNYGLDPAVVPLVHCACGIKDRPADYMVDVTGLPDPVRIALGIMDVDYLCDGCTTRLFREGHITQEDFNKLLGAPPENLAMVRGYDAEHARAMQARPGHKKPKHKPLDIRGLTPPNKQAGLQAFVPSVTDGAPLPLSKRSYRHADSVAKLQREGVLASVSVAQPTPMVNPSGQLLMK